MQILYPPFLHKIYHLVILSFPHPLWGPNLLPFLKRTFPNLHYANKILYIDERKEELEAMYIQCLAQSFSLRCLTEDIFNTE